MSMAVNVQQVKTANEYRFSPLRNLGPRFATNLNSSFGILRSEDDRDKELGSSDSGYGNQITAHPNCLVIGTVGALPHKSDTGASGSCKFAVEVIAEMVLSIECCYCMRD